MCIELLKYYNGNCSIHKYNTTVKNYFLYKKNMQVCISCIYTVYCNLPTLRAASASDYRVRWISPL